MTYKTITVCLNEIAVLDRLLEITRQLAAQHEAHVKGLYIIPAIQVYGDGMGGGLAPAVNDVIRNYFEAQLPTVKSKFETIMQEDGLNFDFQAVFSDTPELFSQTVMNAKVSDLVIASARTVAGESYVDADFVERLVLGVGRPVLIVPTLPQPRVNADEVLVAWDNSREAARAIFDALPLVKNAKVVHVVSIDSTLDGNIPGAEIAETLSRHGIRVDLVKASSDGLNPGESLLRAANELGVGLIVMGCYGHARFSELVFGGATRHVLAHLDRPVIMSH